MSSLAADTTQVRIIDAALVQCREVGLRRVTMEDVARRAGLGRATIYRHFPSKDALVSAMILNEAEGFFTALDEAIAECGTTEERLVEGFAFALQWVRGHALLEKLRRTEPEALLPHLIGGGELIRIATEAVAARVHGTPTAADRETAELLVRLVLSLALTPDTVLGADDPAAARRVARRYLVPGLCGA